MGVDNNPPAPATKFLKDTTSNNIAVVSRAGKSLDEFEDANTPVYAMKLSHKMDIEKVPKAIYAILLFIGLLVVVNIILTIVLLAR